MNTDSIITAAFGLMTTAFAFSSCNLFNSDPAGTANFNRHLVETYMLARAVDNKTPIIIEDISRTQRITLHGETLLTAVCSVKGEGLAQHQLIYFVSKIDNSTYLSGGNDLLKEIEKDGFQIVSDRVFSQKKAGE
jgi:hypothetical protein